MEWQTHAHKESPTLSSFVSFFDPYQIQRSFKSFVFFFAPFVFICWFEKASLFLRVHFLSMTIKLPTNFFNCTGKIVYVCIAIGKSGREVSAPIVIVVSIWSTCLIVVVCYIILIRNSKYYPQLTTIITNKTNKNEKKRKEKKIANQMESNVVKIMLVAYTNTLTHLVFRHISV